MTLHSLFLMRHWLKRVLSFCGCVRTSLALKPFPCRKSFNVNEKTRVEHDGNPLFETLEFLLPTAAMVCLMSITILNQSCEMTEAAAAYSARAYQPRGAAVELFYARDDEVLMDGPAGTGKSRALLEKLHLCAMKYDGMRGLVVRKTRASLTESGLVTYEEKVLPATSPARRGPQRRYRQLYKYKNGSEIIVGGMDDPNRVMSTEYDLILALEATELADEDVDNLTTRLRNGRMPYQQMIMDCNPGSPNHWLNKRCNPVGESFESARHRTRRLLSRHEDNPELWDAARGCWTEKGAAYIAKLDRLPGVRKLRLRNGVWAMAEGMVYGDVWDPAHHLRYRFEVPKHWPRIWVVDFGFTNPFCWQCWAMDSDGRLFRIAEIYKTKTLVEDHARRILRWMKEAEEPAPLVIICDPADPEGMATLERALGMSCTAALKGPGSVETGIQHVAARLRKAEDDEARLFYLRDSVLDVDEDLREAKKPACSEEEYEGYVWATTAAGLKEVPVDRNNHGMDTARYLVTYVDTQFSQGVF